MTPRKPTAPKHLTAETKKWWQSVATDYQLEDHHYRLLTLAAEAWDRGEQARVTIKKDGLTFRDDRGNVRAHPLINVEKDCRIAFARLIRELDLDVEPPSSPRRAPGIQSNRG